MVESSNTSSAGTEWTVRARYETTDGDRVTLHHLEDPKGDRFAVSYTYAWPDAPQFIEYPDRLDAYRVFSISLQNATRRGAVAHREG